MACRCRRKQPTTVIEIPEYDVSGFSDPVNTVIGVKSAFRLITSRISMVLATGKMFQVSASEYGALIELDAPIWKIKEL